MMSRRNVISVCIVIAVIMVLVIILASTGIKKEKNNDGNSNKLSDKMKKIDKNVFKF